MFVRQTEEQIAVVKLTLDANRMLLISLLAHMKPGSEEERAARRILAQIDSARAALQTLGLGALGLAVMFDMAHAGESITVDRAYLDRLDETGITFTQAAPKGGFQS